VDRAQEEDLRRRVDGPFVENLVEFSVGRVADDVVDRPRRLALPAELESRRDRFEPVADGVGEGRAGVNVVKLYFYSSLTSGQDRLEALSLESYVQASLILLGI